MLYKNAVTAVQATHSNLNVGRSLLTTPTSTSDALKSAVSTDERHIMASYKPNIHHCNAFQPFPFITSLEAEILTNMMQHCVQDVELTE